MRNSHNIEKGKNFYFNDDEISLNLVPTFDNRRTDCIINILTEKSLNNCKFQEIVQNIEVMKKIDTNMYLFAVKERTPFTLNCKDTYEENYIENTGIIYLKENCNFATENGETIFRTGREIVNMQKEKDLYKFSESQKQIMVKFNNFKFTEYNDNEKIKVTFDMLNKYSFF